MRTKHWNEKQYLDIANALKKVAPNLTTLYEINVKGPFCACLMLNCRKVLCTQLEWIAQHKTGMVLSFYIRDGTLTLDWINGANISQPYGSSEISDLTGAKKRICF